MVRSLHRKVTRRCSNDACFMTTLKRATLTTLNIKKSVSNVCPEHRDSSIYVRSQGPGYPCIKFSKSPGRHGFVRKECAPSWYARRIASKSSLPLTATIKMLRNSFRVFSQPKNAKPSIPGILISRNITAGSGNLTRSEYSDSPSKYFTASSQSSTTLMGFEIPMRARLLRRTSLS
jgi:hypothetical protein